MAIDFVFFPVISSFHDYFPHLFKPGIADLHEECPVFLQDVDSGISEIIIRIPDEQHRLWIHLIGKQKLGEKRLNLAPFNLAPWLIELIENK